MPAHLPLETYAPLHTESVTMTVCRFEPSVAMSVVQQSPSAMWASVEKCSSQLIVKFRGNLVPTEMARVREMHVWRADNTTLAIIVVGMVAYRSHFLGKTSLQDAVARDFAFDWHSPECIMSVVERHFLRIMLGTEGVSIPVRVARPAVRISSIQQRFSTIRDATVHKYTIEERARKLCPFAVRRVREMPVTSSNRTLAISIRRVVTYRPHALGFASLQNLVAHHPALHSDSSDHVSPVHGLGFEALSSLHAVSETILIPVAPLPLVSVSVVDQRARAMPSSVEVCPLNLFERNTLPFVVGRMREMPVGPHQSTFPIGVGRMVAHRFHQLALACLQDVCSSHVALDTGPSEVVMSVAEVQVLFGSTGAKSLSILVMAIGPSVRVSEIEQRFLAIVPSTITVNALYQSPRHLIASIMGRMTEVPVATHKHTASISIACMVAHRPHLLCSACLPDVLAVHHTFDVHPRHFVATVLLFHSNLTSTESVSITILPSLCPFMAISSIDQRSSSMPPSVKIGTQHLVVRNLVATIVRAMREVPTLTLVANQVALSICVRFVITHRAHAFPLAGPQNVACRHETSDVDTLKVVLVDGEALRLPGRFCAERVAIAIMAV
jgi:hypothetical protein